jgi:hypothetical protein
MFVARSTASAISGPEKPFCASASVTLLVTMFVIAFVSACVEIKSAEDARRTG